MSVLKDLYNGKLCPINQMIPKNKGYHPLCREIDLEKAYFIERLSAEDQERFKKLEKLMDEYELMMEYTNFAHGFRLGLMLAFESFQGEEGKHPKP